MYARVITVPIKSDVMDEAVGAYEAFVTPPLREQPGFKGATLLIDSDASTAVSTTFWETEADMLSSLASHDLQLALAEVAPFFAGPPANAHCDVRVQV